MGTFSQSTAQPEGKGQEKLPFLPPSQPREAGKGGAFAPEAAGAGTALTARRPALLTHHRRWAPGGRLPRPCLRGGPSLHSGRRAPPGRWDFGGFQGPKDGDGSAGEGPFGAEGQLLLWELRVAGPEHAFP